MSLNKCVRARVHGRVQGVAFREYTRREAVKLHLSGWVRNCSDGTVEVLAEGTPEQVEQLLAWLAVGSPFSMVTRVEYNEEFAQELGHSFEIRFGG